MSYCTVENIQSYVSYQTLIQLTNDDGGNSVWTEVAKEAILYASTLIDGYLRGRYTLPLDAEFPLLKILCMDIAVYRLYSRRMRDDMPEVIENAYKNAISTLRDIQKGIISLQAENDLLESSSFNALEYKTNKSVIDRLFPKGRLNEY